MTANESTEESATNRSRGPALRFLRRFLMFVIPLGVAAAPFEACLWWLGETLPASMAHERQLAAEADDQTLLFGRAVVSQDFNVYKVEGLRRRAADIVAIGSSRVMQLRAQHFAPHEASFYNAGGALQNLADVEAFYELLSDGGVPRPRVLILGLDPWWLAEDPRHADTTWLDSQSLDDAALDPVGHISSYGRLVDALLDGRVTFDDADYVLSGGLGLRARSGSGFRADGSQHYGNYIHEFDCDPQFRDRENPPIVERAHKGTKQFRFDQRIETERVDRLIAAIRTVPDVQTIVLFPPVSSEVFEALESSPRLWTWWGAYLEQVPERLRSAHVMTVVVRTPSDVGHDDRSMFDGFHPSEVLLGAVIPELSSHFPSDLRVSPSPWTGDKVREVAHSPLSMEPPLGSWTPCPTTE